ncbi:DUF1311 domain-containing protein [Trinickia dinghuensis]|uniref:DUF1311 domain-containing protein n=2 Tax=Trinickia dinghuensis TaxID=2291023 RepID=A0A3D8JS36_9BURK|nr:DUF1311 domain-containing protein [Trinickia dinghuensis]
MPRLLPPSRRSLPFPHWIGLIALTAIPLASHAASFDCAKAASPTEKAICTTPEVSRLDSELAAAWKKALADSRDVSTLKAAQQRWLHERNACDSAAPCLSDRYRERLAQLAGTPLATNRWEQTWMLDVDNPTVGGQLTFTGKAPHLSFELSVYNGGHTSESEGDVTLVGETASYSNSDGCKLTFTRANQTIGVTENSGPTACGEAMGVSFGGKYVTFAAFNAKPSANLVSLKVLENRGEDDAARALLGADYDTLVSTINLGSGTDDLDHLGAHAQNFFVRGLANTNAAIVMNNGSQLWIGLLVFDKSNNVRMRYYTNVPAWKKRVPKTILAWHDQIDKTYPIDMMP